MKIMGQRLISYEYSPNMQVFSGACLPIDYTSVSSG